MANTSKSVELCGGKSIKIIRATSVLTKITDLCLVMTIEQLLKAPHNGRQSSVTQLRIRYFVSYTPGSDSQNLSSNLPISNLLSIFLKNYYIYVTLCDSVKIKQYCIRNNL